jgi:hypothetical protein
MTAILRTMLVAVRQNVCGTFVDTYDALKLPLQARPRSLEFSRRLMILGGT